MSDDAEEFVPGTKRPPGRWLLRGYPGELARGVLQPGSECSVVIDRGDGPEAWIGEVIERNCQGVILRLFGSGKLLVVPFVQLSRANTLPEPPRAHLDGVARCCGVPAQGAGSLPAR